MDRLVLYRSRAARVEQLVGKLKGSKRVALPANPVQEGERALLEQNGGLLIVIA